VAETDSPLPETTSRSSWLVALPHTAAAVPMARSVVRAALAELGETADPDTAELLTAELVANAVEHAVGDRPIRLVVALLPTGRCQVEVHDDDPRPPGDLSSQEAAVMPDPWQENGRGLLLIRTLSADCGHRKTDGGKAVWFTLTDRELRDDKLSDRHLREQRDLQDPAVPEQRRAAS
jgi:anti-sigma regulatory factor (Ser/Thr protein kinase)